ncbi:GPI transamidase component PIG-S [Linum perenne]
MAEISELPASTAPTLETSSKLDFDSKTMRTTKPGLKRLFLTFSVLIAFLLGFAFLWRTVEIYRSPLPFEEMEAISKEIESNHLQFPCHFQAVFHNFELRSSDSSLDPDSLRSSILAGMKKLTKQPETRQCGFCSGNFTVSVIVDSAGNYFKTNCSYQCGGIGGVNFGDDDEVVDEALRSVLNENSSAFGGKMYTLVVANGGALHHEPRATVGKYRHGWIVGKELEAEAATRRVVEMFVKVFINGGKDEGAIHGEFMPVGSDGKIVLSFSLLNSNPEDWIYDWDFQRIDETLLSPVIEALKPIADISVESQVLYYTPKSSFSHWDESLSSYVFSTKELPFFVNSNEWHLDTSVAAGGRSKILQFVVYIPSSDECPLALQLPNGEISRTNGFISPMWGGVMVWNTQSCLKYSDSELPVRHLLSPDDLHKIFEVLMGQLRQLFGLKSDSIYVGEAGAYKLLASEKGFTEWELDVLSRQHTCFDLRSSGTTLGSLSRLVQSLPRMIIKDEIGKQVAFSLEAAKLARSNASAGLYDASAVSAREARSLAEDAFFHPSIMSVSYFSFEHCFAVYSPFFLPVLLHVLLAAVREWRRYKKEKAKYLLWNAKVKTT